MIALSVWLACSSATKGDLRGTGPSDSAGSNGTSADSGVDGTSTDTAVGSGDTGTFDLHGDVPTVALKAPTFTVSNRDGSPRTQADLIGHPTVFWFYPLAGSSG